MYTQTLFVFLISLVHGISTTPCWARNNTHDNIVVGFDIGITHGTVTAAFANGTFLDVVRLEAGPAYQARISQRLHEEGLVDVNQSLSRFGILPKDHGETIKKASSEKNDLQSSWTRLRLKMHVFTGAEGSAQLDLDDLILGTKRHAETILRIQIDYVTITTPSFLPSGLA